jgi:hypothetical protein
MIAKGYDEKAIKLVTEPPEKPDDQDPEAPGTTEQQNIKIVTDTKESDLDEIKTALNNLCELIDKVFTNLEDIKKAISVKEGLEGQDKYKDLLEGSEEIEQPPKKASPFKVAEKKPIFGGKQNA